MSDINLPNPNPTVINLYTHTLHNKLTDLQNERVFIFKTSESTVSTRFNISDQIVLIKTQDAVFPVLLYDLITAWIVAKQFQTTLPMDSEQRLVLQIPNTAPSAIHKFLKLSLLKILDKQNEPVPSDPEPVQNEHDQDLKHLLRLADQFEVGILIRRRIMHDIYSWIDQITQLCHKEWSLPNLIKWLGWVVFGLEEKPIILWILEMVIIKQVEDSKRMKEGCFIDAK